MAAPPDLRSAERSRANLQKIANREAPRQVHMGAQVNISAQHLPASPQTVVQVIVDLASLLLIACSSKSEYREAYCTSRHAADTDCKSVQNQNENGGTHALRTAQVAL